MNEETLKIKILADISDMKKGMNDVKGQMDGIKQKGDGLAGGLKKIGKVIVAAFAVKAIIEFGKKIVTTTADLQAMDAQFDQIFKGTEGEKALERINKQSEELGIHGDRLTKSWNSFGGQFKGAGMEAEQAMSATEKATSLAADAAAFYDQSLETTSGSLASFMKGNFAAGDAIGVFTNAKQMDIKSNEMYGKSWQDLSEDERQWLLLDTVGKTYEMNGAMGQAARESENYENVMGNLKATWGRFLATIGAPILSVVVTIMKSLIAAVQWLTDKVKTLDWSKFTEGGGIIDRIKEIAAQVVAFFVDNWPLIQETAVAIFNRIRDVVGEVVAFFVDNMPKMKEMAGNVFEFISQVWKDTLKPAFEAIMDVVGVVWDIFKIAFPYIQKVVEIAFKIIKQVYETVLKPVFDVIITLVKAVMEKFKENMPQIQAFFERMTERVDKAYNNVLKPVFDLIGAYVKWVADKWTQWIGPIVGWVFEWFGKIATAIESKMDAALETVSTVIAGIKGFFDGIGTTVTNVTGYFKDIYDGIKDKIEAARDVVEKAINKIKGFFNFKWEWPKLKMPKFSLTGSFSLVPPSVPKMAVSWNARGAIFKKPAILGENGVGDASNGFGSSPEVVAPLSDLKQMLGLGSNDNKALTINLNGDYSFRDKDDMDYFMNKFAMATRRTT